MSALTRMFQFSMDAEEEVDENDLDGVLGPDNEAEACALALAKKPEKRTQFDLEVLQRATAAVKFFRQLDDPGQHLELCRVLTLRKFGNGAQVFKQGDEGTTFHIIYSGGVEVYVNDYKSGKEGVGARVATLGPGETYGELALLGDGVRRGTVVTTAITQTLVIEKETYDSACATHHVEKIAKRTAFLKQVFLFKDFEHEALVDLAKVLSDRKFEKNQTIIRQGEATDSMYFIVSGTCRVLTRMHLNESHALKLAASPNETRSHFSALAETSGGFSALDYGSSPPGSPTRSHAGSPTRVGAVGGGAPNFLRLPEKPLLEIAELRPGQYFGEFALLEAQARSSPIPSDSF